MSVRFRFARVTPIFVAAVFALVPGCKGMGGFASGLGHVASGMGHIAAETAHVAGAAAHVTGSVLSHAAPVVASGVVHAAPVIEDAAEIAALSGSEPGETVEVAPQPWADEPLNGNGDPCERCSQDVDCDTCVGYAGYGCRLAPPGAFARCESSAPADAPPAAPAAP